MFYRCKNCGGNVVFDPGTKKMVCESCSTEEQQQMVAQEKKQICNNCGGEIEAPENALALSCPYCGTYVIFEDRMEGAYQPDLVLPFAVSKKKAIELLRNHFAQKLFLPGNFCSASSLETMEGRYVPFWMYDMNTHIRFDGEGDKIRTWREGDYECTETSTFHIIRDFEIDYDKIPIDASDQMPDRQMDLVEPYRYGELGEFTPEYLSGFLAQVYDEDSSALLPRAAKKAEKYSEGYLEEYNREYAIVRTFSSHKDTRERESFYAFLPVWRYVYRFQGKDYEFFVNGQTGKVVGKPPISRTRAAGFTLLTGAALFFFLEMLLYFLEVL